MFQSFSFIKFILAGTLIFLFSACENDLKEVKALTEKKVSVDVVVDVTAYYSQKAKVKSKLTAPLMKHYMVDTPYFEFPRSLHVDFYDDTLKVESKVGAMYGRYIEHDHKVFLKDSVVVSNLKGDTLHTSELWWDNQKGIFYTDKPVRIHQRDGIKYGLGLQADQNFSWFNTRQAHGPIQVPKDFGNDFQ